MFSALSVSVRRPTVDANRLIRTGVVVALAYVVAAKLGFRMSYVAEQVTTVWPPTGLAEAALLLWGRSLWPAIWLGAFVANATASVPLWSAVAVATGNTLEAVVAAWLLSRLSGFDPTLRRVRDALAFVVLAGLGATAVSATLGSTTLCAAGVQPWSRFTTLWPDWWLGDAVGAVVVAPALLTTVRLSWTRVRRIRAETAAIVIGCVATTQLIFGRPFLAGAGHHPLEYVIFPFVVAAAVRLGQPATALVVLGASAVTIWNTIQGTGPFAGADVHQGLILLQVFTGVLAGTGLLLAAAMAEQKTGERRRSAGYAVGEVLTRAPNLAYAAPEILRSICTELDWIFSAFWLVDGEIQRLRCLIVWRDPTVPIAFETVTLQTIFPSGVGLPGRVWADGKAFWVENVVEDPNFPRWSVAREAGIRGAFAFPIRLGTQVLGVVECFNRVPMTPDPDLLRTMSGVGYQIGQFMERKRIEAAVAAEQRRTRVILDTALDAIVGMDHHGTITGFNPAAERIFGYSQDQVLGRELAELLVPPALRDKHRAGLLRYLETGEGAFIDRRVETTGYHASGREFPVEIAVTRVVDEDPPRFTGFVRDLTARIEAEKEREQLLQSESSARREAEAANRAKDEFLATLSHELRTPLNAIVGWARMLLDGSVEQAKTRKALEVIDRNAGLQMRLVDDILDVSRIIAGGLQLDVRPVDLGAVIGAALDAIRPAAEAKKIEIHAHLSASARPAEGDPQRLQQIVWNLLANAVKFTDAGGRIEIELIDAGPDGVRIVVRDNGAGIDPSFLPHVFERFRQADGTVSRQHGGLGLGLAIVRHLVELHGGTVRAESDGRGKGSTFTIELPRFAKAVPSRKLSR